MISLDEARRRVSARIAPVEGDYIIERGQTAPINLFAGTDMPALEVLELLQQEMAQAFSDLLTTEVPKDIHPASPLTGSYMRVLLLGFEFGREVGR